MFFLLERACQGCPGLLKPWGQYARTDGSPAATPNCNRCFVSLAGADAPAKDTKHLEKDELRLRRSVYGCMAPTISKSLPHSGCAFWYNLYYRTIQKKIRRKDLI